MQNFDTTGGRRPFPKYRKPHAVWKEFLAWWAVNYPGQDLPDDESCARRTGLSRSFCYHRLKETCFVKQTSP